MEKIISDIIITLHSENKKDTFLLEAQIDDDSRTAKAMKAGGEAMDKIMRYTGLSRREIMAL